MSQQSFLRTTATGSDINFTITTFSSDEILVYVDGVKKTILFAMRYRCGLQKLNLLCHRYVPPQL